MGFCVKFTRTWTPGYNNPEYIDPNLAFSFQRKLNIAKKIAWWIFVLTLLCCVAVLLFTITHRSSDGPPCESKTSNESLNRPVHLVGETNAELQIQNENLTIESITSEYLTTTTTIETTTDDQLPKSLHDEEVLIIDDEVKKAQKNWTDILEEQLHKNYEDNTAEDVVKRNITTRDDSAHQLPNFPNLSSGAPSNDSVCTHRGFRCNRTQRCISSRQRCNGRFDCVNHGKTNLVKHFDRSDELNCSCRNASFTCNKNQIGAPECVHMSLVCDSVKDCSNGQDEAFCTVVSKRLDKVTLSHMRNDEIEGYVLVRVRGSWHPYCTEEWSEDIGGRICTFLGFEKFRGLQVIELNQINRRLGVQLTGRGKISSEETKIGYRSPLWLLDDEYNANTSGPIEEVITESGQEEHNCTVGYLLCSKF